MEHLDLRAPYQRHSPTSIAAAVGIEPAAGTLRAKVLEYIRGAGRHGATDEEIQTGARIGANTQRPRRVELLRARLIADSGRVRPAMSGKDAVVWVAAEYVEGA